MKTEQEILKALIDCKKHIEGLKLQRANLNESIKEQQEKMEDIITDYQIRLNAANDDENLFKEQMREQLDAAGFEAVEIVKDEEQGQ